MERLKFIFDILATILSSFAVFIYAWQLIIQKRTLKEDHERSRREKGIDILNHWFSTLDRNNSTARKLAESLSEENLLSIYHCEKFEMPSTPKNKQYFSVLFEESNKKHKNSIHISAQQATEI